MTIPRHRRIGITLSALWLVLVLMGAFAALLEGEQGPGVAGAGMIFLTLFALPMTVIWGLVWIRAAPKTAVGPTNTPGRQQIPWR